MSADEISHSPLVVDILGKASTENQPNKRLVFDLSFGSVRIPRAFGKADCYVACQGATISFTSDRRDIADCTREASVEFTYTKTHSKRTGFALELAPEVEGEAGPVKAKVRGPKAAVKKDKVGETGISFTASENRLSLRTSGPLVSWKVSMVRIEHAISDFLYGNLPLWIDFQTKGRPLMGKLTIIPGVYRFDSEERRATATAELLMSYAVWKAKVLHDRESVVAIKEHV